MYGHAHLLLPTHRCDCGGPGVVKCEDGTIRCARCALDGEKADLTASTRSVGAAPRREA